MLTFTNREPARDLPALKLVKALLCTC